MKYNGYKRWRQAQDSTYVLVISKRWNEQLETEWNIALQDEIYMYISICNVRDFEYIAQYLITHVDNNMNIEMLVIYEN